MHKSLRRISLLVVCGRRSIEEIGAHSLAQGEPPRALRVTLLGLGTVGLGVYRELARRPEAFEVRQVLVRRRRARLAPVELQRGEFLAEVCAEHNALVVATASGERIVITGKGAGRWPTTEAVLGDLFALARRTANAELEVV